MSDPVQDDPIVALNQVLSEVIDLILEVIQADRKVPQAHELHGELDQLFTDLVSWRTMLGDQDVVLGLSPLSFMTSAAGRKPLNLWPGSPRTTRYLLSWANTFSGSRITCAPSSPNRLRKGREPR